MAEIGGFVLIDAKQIDVLELDKLILVDFVIVYNFIFKYFSLSITCV